ncbi:nucleotide sugar dehydrogenase [Amylibacter sp.]|nr:nucleotide sugar dehydrogenase [Amylibacter sp.]
MRYKITVVGAGYVGMSIAALLAQHNEVVVLDVDKKRIDLINAKKSTVKDADIDRFFDNKNLKISATDDLVAAYDNASFIVVATPTNYDPEADKFDTSLVDKVCRDALRINDNALVVIKSTLPIGHTAHLQASLGTKRVIFSPEFLREGKSLHDNLYPSRIIIGGNCPLSTSFARLLVQACELSEPETLFMDSTEAEAVKLFANTYLAMRVSFFNELDSYTILNNLDAESIIKGVSLDPRVGLGYNNPSFGYGGYCLPKDTKQLLASFSSVPQNLISAIVASNDTRIALVADEILKESPKCVGIYRLVMKAGSDNFRSSAVKYIIQRLLKSTVRIIIYEPDFDGIEYLNCKVINDFGDFESQADVIVANRKTPEIEKLENKVFSRDVFGDN